MKLPPAERVAAVKMKVKEVAKSNGLIKDSKLSKINSRDVYKDPKTGDLYSVDTQHGRFEKTNNKGSIKERLILILNKLNLLMHLVVII